jgi:ElaB/YqjD/DUF883 family membrane-anchored ribosome-binding protein
MNKNGITSVSSAAQVLDEKLDALNERLKSLIDQGAQKVDALMAKLIGVRDRTITRGGDVLDRMTAIIKAHPLRAVAVAFGAGYLGMRLLRR